MKDAPERIPQLPREEWTEAARDVFGFYEDPAARESGSRANSIMVLANHPKLAIASMQFGKYLLVDSELAERQKELTILRVAWRYQCKYQWVQHVFTGRKIGMTDAEFKALQAETIPPSAFPPEEMALLLAVDQLFRDGRIDDETWGQLDASMTRHQVMDFVYSVGFFTMNAWAFGAMGVQVEPGYQAFSILNEE